MHLNESRSHNLKRTVEIICYRAEDPDPFLNRDWLNLSRQFGNLVCGRSKGAARQAGQSCVRLLKLSRGKAMAGVLRVQKLSRGVCVMGGRRKKQ
jgi:hypothetical protein